MLTILTSSLYISIRPFYKFIGLNACKSKLFLGGFKIYLHSLIFNLKPGISILKKSLIWEHLTLNILSSKTTIGNMVSSSLGNGSY